MERNILNTARQILERQILKALKNELEKYHLEKVGIEYCWVNSNGANRVLRGKLEPINVTEHIRFGFEKKYEGTVKVYPDGDIQITLNHKEGRNSEVKIIWT